MATNSSQYQYGCIYKVINLVNGKVYVGQTTKKRPEDRWSYHKSVNQPKLTLLQRAIKKHGVDKFKFEVVCYVSDQESLNSMEDLFITKFNALAPMGYTCKGSQGRTGLVSDETRAKMRAIRLGKEPVNKGKKRITPISEESRENYRKGNANKCLGRKVSEETLKKMSEYRKGKVFMTPEQYRAIGEKNSGPQTEEFKRQLSMSKSEFVIKLTDKNTGKQSVYECGYDLTKDGLTYKNLRHSIYKGRNYYKHYHLEVTLKDKVN